MVTAGRFQVHLLQCFPRATTKKHCSKTQGLTLGISAPSDVFLLLHLVLHCRLTPTHAPSPVISQHYTQDGFTGTFLGISVVVIVVVLLLLQEVSSDGCPRDSLFSEAFQFPRMSDG